MSTRHYFSASFCVLILISSLPLRAATLDSLDGKVFVNRGDGFRPVQSQTNVQPGTSVMVSETGKARLVYFEGCAQNIAPGQVIVVSANPPCSAIETGATPNGNGAGGNGPPPSAGGFQNMMPFEGAEYVLGAAAIGGIIAAAVVGLSDDDDNAASGE